MIIADGGSTRCCVMMAHPVHETVKLAADELQKYIYQVTGASMPVLTEAAPWTGARILVGDSRAVRALGIDLSALDLGEEGFIQKLADEDTLVLAGAQPRATLYAAYDFLEKQVGLRWYASDASFVPSLDTLRVESLDEVKRPAFEYRDAYWRDAFDGEYAVRNLMNSNKADISARQGGRMKFYNFHHSFDELVPTAEYFDEHPEYYALVDGRRVREHTQLCLTNPEVMDRVVERLECWIAENPDCRVFSVAQNDWANFCTCPACAALDEAEESHAGTMISFVNKVAERIEKDHPQILIHTFAYQYTRKAPRTVRPRHNVIVRLCSIECCFAHPLDGNGDATILDPAASSLSRARCALEGEPDFLRDLKDWAAITDRLYVWDYTTDFAHYLMPLPVLDALGSNIRLFAKIGVKGLLEQGNFSHGGGGNLAELYAWLQAKLMWDPEQDIRTLTEDFVRGYYGRGAEEVLAYLRLWQEAVRPWHMRIYEGPDAPFVSDELLAKSDALLCKALWKEKDPKVSVRLRKLRAGITYMVLCRMPPETPGRDLLIDRFGWEARELGITELNERVGLEQGLEFMKRTRYNKDRTGSLRVDYKM